VGTLNNIYNAARHRLPLALLNWTTIDLMLTAWSGDAKTAFFPADLYIGTLVSHGLVERGSSLPITSKTVAADGTAQTNQVVIPKVAIGAPITFFTMSERKPTHSPCELILFIDQSMGLPFIANGLDLVVQPDWLSKRGWWKA